MKLLPNGLSLRNSCLLAALLSSVSVGYSQVTNPVPETPAASGIVLQIEEIGTIPQSAGSAPRARINHLKPMHDGQGTLMVNDLRGGFYTISEGQINEYVDFDDVFPAFADSPGLGTGFTSFAFHPEFATNGKFYTAHSESPSATPVDFPSKVAEAPVALHGVVTEWIATDPLAATFAGDRRELMRVELTHTIHGMQEISFNPNAGSTDPDYEMLYICIGDAGSTIRGYPGNTQTLDSVLGTILRIDVAGNNSANSQYGVPSDNPWATDGDPDTFDEIWAYGFRNPHRISWDTAGDGKMLSGDIGERNIEEVNLIEPGGNYGWNVREGTFVINADWENNPSAGTNDEVFELPENDDELGFTYPVVQYDHDEGFAIVGGYVYRGASIDVLKGKYIFGDIRSGELYVTDADPLENGTQSPFEEMELELDGQRTTIAQIGGSARGDLRFGYDDDNELYILEKSRGKVFKIIGALDESGGGGEPVVGWQEISNFEDPADVDLWTVAPNGDNTDPTDLPRFILQDDPLDSGQGQVVAINPGVPTTGGLATSFTTPLPWAWETDDSLPIGEPQYYTLYYKIHHPNVDGALGKNNSTIGTIDKDNSGQNEFGFYSWPTYNMIFRDGGVGGDNFPEEDNGLPLNSHNGTTYFMPYASATETEADGARMPAADAHADPSIWYEVWMVANMDDLTAEVYVSGGQFGDSPRLINIIPNYRNGAAVDHDTILINTSSDGVNFPHSTFFDDVYVSNGKLLTSPNPPQGPADWQEISDFEEASDVDLWTVAPNGDNTDPADLPRFILQDDPLGSGQGQVVAINPGVPTTGGLATSFHTPLPYVWETDESLPIGEPQYHTLFFKVHHPNVEGALGKNNSTIGTIDTDNSSQNEFGFYSWPTYNMIFRDGGVGGDNFPAEDNGLPLNSHNGTTYFMPYASANETEANGARMPAADAHADPSVWYNVWMVANMDDLTAEVYVSGGQFGENARLINIIPNYRNGAATDHDTILINTSSDGVNFPHSTFFDDVFVTRGKHLEVPGEPVEDTTPRAEETAAGSTTIATTGTLPSEAVAGNLVFLDDGTELGKIASVAGNVITLEAALAVAVAADARLTFVEDNDVPAATLGQLVNLSTRSQVGIGDDVLIGGFVIGKDNQQVLIQATGPELTGVAGILADPYLIVTNTTGGVNTVVGENDDWESDQGQLISDLWGGNPPLAAGSKSSAVVVTLEPGTYTATISGVGDTTGVALIEVYEID